jgi:hypothetical protein
MRSRIHACRIDLGFWSDRHLAITLAQNEGGAIPFPDASFRTQLARDLVANGARTLSRSLWHGRRAPSVKGSWVNGAAPASAHYLYENDAHSYRLTAAKLAQSKINMASFRIGSATEWTPKKYEKKSMDAGCSGLAPFWEKSTYER